MIRRTIKRRTDKLQESVRRSKRIYRESTRRTPVRRSRRSLRESVISNEVVYNVSGTVLDVSENDYMLMPPYEVIEGKELLSNVDASEYADIVLGDYLYQWVKDNYPEYDPYDEFLCLGKYKFGSGTVRIEMPADPDIDDFFNTGVPSGAVHSSNITLRSADIYE